MQGNGIVQTGRKTPGLGWLGKERPGRLSELSCGFLFCHLCNVNRPLFNSCGGFEGQEVIGTETLADEQILYAC